MPTRWPRSPSGRPVKVRIEETRQHRHGFTLHCDGCGRSVNIESLDAHGPPRARLDEIEDRLRCSRCGHRGAEIMLAGPDVVANGPGK